MSQEPRRFDAPILGIMELHPAGLWVRYEDFDALTSERDRLRAALQEVVDHYDFWRDGTDSDSIVDIARCAITPSTEP